MKVHIVCRDWQEDKILPRLARYLRDGNGWSLGPEPDPSADLNYWIVYIDIAERHPEWLTNPKTKTAAYFSHFETGTRAKVNWWRQAEPYVDFAVVTADQYGIKLRDDGNRDDKAPPLKVRVPIDPQFRMLDEIEEASRLPLIGVSGFIRDGSGRKGEREIIKLQDELVGKAEFTAVGQGWPFPHELLEWSELPAWYNRLYIYLCASTIEGVPMPPLEALACRVPVVIPTGVGMLDELPHCEGIHRYAAGNYEGMKDAVAEALDSSLVGSKVLSNAVEGYDIGGWCSDHLWGFRALLGDAKGLEMGGKRGVYYVAFGGPARKCAEAAMRSWKKHMPDVPIALVAAEPIGLEDHFIQADERDIGARMHKIRVCEWAPPDWEYILYLDADTLVTRDVSFLFETLEDGWDVVITKNPVDYHIIRNMVRPDNQAECDLTFNLLGSDELLQLNGGVFGFRRSMRTRAFFRAWFQEWERYVGRDQAALLRALHSHPLKIVVLNNKWNTVIRDGYLPMGTDPKKYTAGILHFPLKARRWTGLSHGPNDGEEAWGMVEKWQEEQGGMG